MIVPPTGISAAGICHASCENEDIPAGWLIYIEVEDVEKNAQLCKELGGEVPCRSKVHGRGTILRY